MKNHVSYICFCLSFAFFGSEALAACKINQDPDDILCLGNDNDGFFSELDSITVEVANGARVRNQGTAIRLNGDNSRVNVIGSVESRQGNAIDVSDTTDIYVYGSIEAANTGVLAGDGLDLSLLINSTLVAGNKGVEALNDADIFLGGGQNIEAEGDGIDVQRDAFIDNNGIIQSSGLNGNGVNFKNGSLLNWGIINSSQNTGVNIDGPGSASAVIANIGTISGEIGLSATNDASTASQSIDNVGSIIGRSGIAFDLGAGDDVLSMQTGSSVEGDGFFGLGDDLLTFDAGGMLDGLVGSFGLFDGGEGFDTMKFFSLDFDDVTISPVSEDVISLSVLSGLSDFSLNLKGWEQIEFSNKRFSYDELVGAVAVPLPGAFALLWPVFVFGAYIGVRRKHLGVSVR